MKQLTALLLCLLLCGCGRQTSPAQPDSPSSPTAAAAGSGLYDPAHPMEQKYPGLVRAYPLADRDTWGIRAIGNDVLLLSGQAYTRLQICTGEDLREAASLTLDFPLPREDPSLQVHENGISFFDPLRQETVVLNRRLEELRRIPAPQGLAGRPLLCTADNTLYYCTGWSVMAWDLTSGIRRTVKELSWETQELTALHRNGRVLEVTVRDNGTGTRLLLSADRGLELGSLSRESALWTADSRYFTAFPSGYQTLMVFGEAETEAELLLPEDGWQQQFYLPEDHAAVTVCEGTAGARLNYYELNTGILRSCVTLEAGQVPTAIVNTGGHAVYILAQASSPEQDILYRWDVLRQKPDPSNTASYTAAYRSPDDPDMEALEQCREYANAIGRKYGITVRIWEDAAAVQPWDYRFTPECLAPVLRQELKFLDQRLEAYPESLLQQTISHFTGLTVCLVRQITGTAESGSLSAATGIQFFHDREAYVVITAGKHSRQALYHELYHVMETHILTESTALDRWETLNPGDFSYGAEHPQADIYLQGQTRAFVDRYSMVSSKEDRARVLENAMLPEKQELFQSEYMQRKLNALCTGIREAYRLKQHPEPLPWEQYLINPLTPDA